MKTSIIISNLHKDDFIINNDNSLIQTFKSLSFADQIKLKILNYNSNIIDDISHWSNLPFLNRIIIIFKNEEIATEIYSYLQKGLADYDVKITLQENLLKKSKSSESLFDDNLNVTKSLDNFKTFYNDDSNKDKNFSYDEPEPQQFNVISDLSKLGIDLNDYNDKEQMKELSGEEDNENKLLDNGDKNDGNAPLRRRSTKTLFKPKAQGKKSSALNKLSINTKLDTNDNADNDDEYPSSPVITLDETF
ncbi:unnamed protein product [Candida verbasci]|uniref:Uncharacterized protein n=1 Tax=Candida verbasci TaxID=1227364 RepID=A0A9W4U0A6_9ASCO|nr:unnamed protein product [Candida verbasci]